MRWQWARFRGVHILPQKRTDEVQERLREDVGLNWALLVKGDWLGREWHRDKGQDEEEEWTPGSLEQSPDGPEWNTSSK